MFITNNLPLCTLVLTNVIGNCFALAWFLLLIDHKTTWSIFPDS